MSKSEPRPEHTYTPYQQEFLRRFVTDIRPGSVHLLFAPVGTGKSFALAGAVAELVRAGRIDRILVLAPAPLAARWPFLLGRWDIAPAIVDGQALRLLRQDLDIKNRWPAGVYVMSSDFAKRPDIRDQLETTPWDLVVVDEAHLLSGQRLGLVEGLAANDPAPALLLATHVLAKGVQRITQAATVIDWHEAIARFREAQEASIGPMVVSETRQYRRSPDEVMIARKVMEYARQVGPPTGMILLKLASSSINSLEGSLIRWVEAPDRLADANDQIEDLLLQIEQLRVDSRLDCFKSLVAELVDRGVRHVVAMCEFRATLDYLVAAVERLDFSVFGLFGGMTDEQGREVLARFESEGGLLITTGVSEGVSLDFVEAAIHYDLPTSPIAFAMREGRYNRVGRSQPCTVYFFEDETGALPLENLALRMVRKLDLVTDDTDFDIDSLFRAALADDSVGSAS